MFGTNENQFFELALFKITGKEHQVSSFRSASGGMINNSFRVVTNIGEYFIKWNDEADEDLFEKEQKGLELLQTSESVKVPQSYGTDKVDNKNFLVLELISQTAPSSIFWEDFGHSLARMHQFIQPAYGLDYDNHIGKLPQKNELKEDWINFLIENRLEVQLGLALYNGLINTSYAKRFRAIYAQLPGLLPDEPASLLHGDLWSGNFMVGPEGKVCIFDPAVYFGHREMEIAFTRLFGGFDLRFYDSYHESFPLEPGFEERMDIYNLYPLLVHVNLFGTSYLSGIEQTLRRFL